MRQVGAVEDGSPGHPQGVPLRGSGGAWFGETPSTGHLLRISTPGRRGMLLGGGVGGGGGGGGGGRGGGGG
ncbi:MAG: aldehyde dehydrogenase, partial [Caldilineaceae bacterium SB0662_bin_25]|nr:aldehyde dehydrogenase [Caldilineaceae bacterium SB0662_bin_25]